MKNRIIRPAAYQSVAGLFDDAQPIVHYAAATTTKTACGLSLHNPGAGVYSTERDLDGVPVGPGSRAALSALLPTGMVNRWAL